METSPPPRPAINLTIPLYFQLVYTLTNLLPPPLDDTQEGLSARNHAAIAKVAALLPVNANELDLAAHCIAARAQAEEMLRLIRQNADDIGLVLRLNAQYGSMVRTSLSVHGRLMRVQALRQKREAVEGAANQDAWIKHFAERCMLEVTDPGAKPPEVCAQTNPEQACSASTSAHSPVTPGANPQQAAAPKVAPVATPAACVNQTDHPSENETDSHDEAFETWLSAQLPHLMARGSGKMDLSTLVREAMIGSRLATRQLSANGRDSPVRLP